MPELAPIYELRTQPVQYFLWGGILGAAFLLVASGVVTDPMFWLPTAFMGLGLTILLTWLATTRLALTGESIQYRSLLSRTDVPLANVLNARFERGFIALSYKPYCRIIITTREGAGKKEITFNAGLFDPSLSTRWVHTLNSRIS